MVARPSPCCSKVACSRRRALACVSPAPWCGVPRPLRRRVAAAAPARARGRVSCEGRHPPWPPRSRRRNCAVQQSMALLHRGAARQEGGGAAADYRSLAINLPGGGHSATHVLLLFVVRPACLSWPRAGVRKSHGHTGCTAGAGRCALRPQRSSAGGTLVPPREANPLWPEEITALANVKKH